jgi:DNA-binding MarR family transcriptional regulator
MSTGRPSLERPARGDGLRGMATDAGKGHNKLTALERRAGHHRAAPAEGAEPLVDLSKQDFERLATLRHAIRRLARQTELEARQAGIAPQQYLLMLNIKGFPGREWANITELAERLQVRHNAVIGLVNRAVARGLVMRVQDAEVGDRRVVQVRLTELGDRILQQLARRLHGERTSVREAFEQIYLSSQPRLVAEGAPHATSGHA